MYALLGLHFYWQQLLLLCLYIIRMLLVKTTIIDFLNFFFIFIHHICGGTWYTYDEYTIHSSNMKKKIYFPCCLPCYKRKWRKFENLYLYVSNVLYVYIHHSLNENHHRPIDAKRYAIQKMLDTNIWGRMFCTSSSTH